MSLHNVLLSSVCGDISPSAGERCMIINTITTTSPNWVLEDGAKFGYDYGSVALLCSVISHLGQRLRLC